MTGSIVASGSMAMRLRGVTPPSIHSPDCSTFSISTMNITVMPE